MHPASQDPNKRLNSYSDLNVRLVYVIPKGSRVGGYHEIMHNDSMRLLLWKLCRLNMPKETPLHCTLYDPKNEQGLMEEQILWN